MNLVNYVMDIKILGSGQEVGRSSIIIEGQSRLMMDCGVKIEPPPPSYPVAEKVDSLVVSHAHLDHVGAVPMLCKKSRTAVYMNDITLELGMMLIKDSMKVAKKEGYATPFGPKEVKNMIKSTKVVSHMEPFRAKEHRVTLWPSGHIPGSSSVLVETKGKKILYTSDIQTTDSRLMKGCRLPGPVDTLIIESTYGFKNHPRRDLVEKDLVRTVEEAMANNETVLFPVFAVGRAQEVMLILEKFANRIMLDGMARQASEIVEEYGYYIRDPHTFRSLLNKVRFVRKNDKRSEIFKKHPIIIASAGMLGGGPAVSYLREISRREGSKVLFTGFLGDDTPGKNLMQTKIYKNPEEEFGVKCDVRQFELSAHTDRNGIFGIIERTTPKNVICVHGERCEELARDIQEHFGANAFAPKNGEIIRV
jgi:putative mRNA 3-end processing factor